MATAYQYGADGFYAGAIEDYGLLPNNATYTEPELRESFIPQWNGEAWEQVENHKGKTGYRDGTYHTITEYGPLPDGWSDTQPEPTREELDARRIAEITARLKEIDAESVRPLRAIAKGEASEEDVAKLAALDAEAENLRIELRTIPQSSEE